MDITDIIRYGRTTIQIGTLEDEPLTGVHHEAEGVGSIIYA